MKNILVVNRRLMTPMLLTLITLMVGGFTIVAEVSAEPGLLDGKTFVSGKEELIFADGMFRSSGCDRWGFSAVPYKSMMEGDTIKFEALATSPKHGTMNWSGTVRSNTIDAKYIWDKKGWLWDRHKEVDVSGTLK